MPEDALDVLADVSRTLRAVPKLREKRVDRALEQGRAEARRGAPRQTGRLAASLDFEKVRDDQVVGTVPDRYIPIVAGVPSRGIPPHDFMERGANKAAEEIERVLDDVVDGVMGRR